ncbi:MAG TPA: P-II family nitrogen regulator [Candidatus Nanoarchaeia archaeon]|nr:P-II family nitrogen regulator [Candidatus Nanoarchaeia archaeon]
MKLIIAYVKPERFREVKKELFKSDISRMSVSRVRGCGEQKGFIEVLRATTDEVTLMPKIRVEIAVNEDFVEPTINAIIKGARTKELGDGKIFVLPLSECIRIRTGIRGPDAIGGMSQFISEKRKKELQQGIGKK